MRKITVPAGIGDSIWLIQKLINCNEKFDFILPGDQPQRGKPLFDLLPQIVASATYGPALTYSKIKELNAQKRINQWKGIREKAFYLAANEWLEANNRIEKFLPDLPTSYTLDYATSEDDQINAEIALDDIGASIPVGIYATSYGNAQKGKGWLVQEWVEFIKLMYRECSEFRFVIIGAEYDEDHTKMIMKELDAFGIAYTNTIGQPLPVVVEILKCLSYFVGYPSGLSIINETLQKDGVMFYTKKDEGIINTWAHPDRIAAGNIKECLFCPPQKIFDWIKNNYQLFQKL